VARLRELRELALLSQTELAQKVGVSKQSVWEWEHGDAKPAPAHRRKLLEVLGVTPQQLLDAIAETAKEAEEEGRPALVPVC
jgi:transcriptional regulator with XRE-family HTH domain